VVYTAHVFKRGIPPSDFPVRGSVPGRIRAFNKGRDPERLRRKYKAMARSTYAFFRGSCHLFWEDWRPGRVLDDAPLAWASGDLHLENFGTFRGDNRLEYFDINDFDEAALAPCTRDLVRCACSILLAADEVGLSAREGRGLCATFMSRYLEALGDGRARWVERETAMGEVRRLIKGLVTRTRAVLLRKRTEVTRSGRRRIRVDGRRALGATERERSWATRLVRAAAEPGERDFFRVLDVARRIAGTGSLGVERYVVLVEGRGSPDRNQLIDLKQARPSAMMAGSGVRRRRWGSEAERVVWVQTHMQAASPALLRAVRAGERSYILRELQPSEDRLDLTSMTPTGFEGVMETTGALVAWAQLRASGRNGAAGPDLLIDHVREGRWQRAAAEYAAMYAKRVQRDRREFRTAWKDGFFAAQCEERAN
jgi:uncharacterized protein (DUF2252 family)